MNKNRILLRDRYFESAVMICIANIDGKDYFILEKRAKNIRQAGEISFPGGKKDKKDKNFRETAIRETLEELQIKRKAITNISKFGILVAATGVIIECYLCKLNIKSLDEIKYSKDEVEKLGLFSLKDSFYTTSEYLVECFKFYKSINIKEYNQKMKEIMK